VEAGRGEHKPSTPVLNNFSIIKQVMSMVIMHWCMYVDPSSCKTIIQKEKNYRGKKCKRRIDLQECKKQQDHK
jgi:hypothetical protein